MNHLIILHIKFDWCNTVPLVYLLNYSLHVCNMNTIYHFISFIFTAKFFTTSRVRAYTQYMHIAVSCRSPRAIIGPPEEARRLHGCSCRNDYWSSLTRHCSFSHFHLILSRALLKKLDHHCMNLLLLCVFANAQREQWLCWKQRRRAGEED